MDLNDPYERRPLEFYMDVVIPAIPGAGLIAVPIGLIDLNTDIEWVQTQGKVRLTSALVSHLLYLLFLVAAAM